MTHMAYPMATPYGLPHMAYGCYGTERYGTERKSLQDKVKSSSVPDPSNPVDNSESGWWA